LPAGAQMLHGHTYWCIIEGANAVYLLEEGDADLNPVCWSFFSQHLEHTYLPSQLMVSPRAKESKNLWIFKKQWPKNFIVIYSILVQEATLVQGSQSTDSQRLLICTPPILWNVGAR
jgi:hypothetical protein